MRHLHFYNDGISIFSIPKNLQETLYSYDYILNDTVSFVGILLDSSNVYVFFPKSYDLVTITQSSIKEARLASKKLLSLLVRYNKNYGANSFNGVNQQTNIEKDTTSLASNYFLLLEYYRKHGAYKRKRKSHNFKGLGRIDWSKTINLRRPVFTENGIPIYLDVISSEIKKIEQSTIVLIQKYLTSIADEIIGWIYSEGDSEYLFPDLKHFIKNQPLLTDVMLSELRLEREKVFDNDSLVLLNAMISILNEDLAISEEHSLLGVKYFWPIWESILKSNFDDKSKEYLEYFPQPLYVFPSNKQWLSRNTQLPDVIVKTNDTLIILDAKYYDVSKSLPGWHDIIKQTYYLSTLQSLSKESVGYNAFVFPSSNTNTGPVEVVVSTFDTKLPFDLVQYPKIHCIYYPINRAIDHFINNKLDIDFLHSNCVTNSQF